MTQITARMTGPCAIEARDTYIAGIPLSPSCTDAHRFYEYVLHIYPDAVDSV